MKFFKRKVEPDKKFTVLECEYDGQTYGFFMNWFRRGNDGSVHEIPNSELPQELVGISADSMIREMQRSVADSITDFKKDLQEKLSKLSNLVNNPDFIIDESKKVP